MTSGDGAQNCFQSSPVFTKVADLVGEAQPEHPSETGRGGRMVTRKTSSVRDQPTGRTTSTGLVEVEGLVVKEWQRSPKEDDQVDISLDCLGLELANNGLRLASKVSLADNAVSKYQSCSINQGRVSTDVSELDQSRLDSKFSLADNAVSKSKSWSINHNLIKVGPELELADTVNKIDKSAIPTKVKVYTDSTQGLGLDSEMDVLDTGGFEVSTVSTVSTVSGLDSEMDVLDTGGFEVSSKTSTDSSSKVSRFLDTGGFSTVSTVSTLTSQSLGYDGATVPDNFVPEVETSSDLETSKTSTDSSSKVSRFLTSQSLGYDGATVPENNGKFNTCNECNYKSTSKRKLRRHFKSKFTKKNSTNYLNNGPGILGQVPKSVEIYSHSKHSGEGDLDVIDDYDLNVEASANKKVNKIPENTSIITNLGEDTADEDINVGKSRDSADHRNVDVISENEKLHTDVFEAILDEVIESVEIYSHSAHSGEDAYTEDVLTDNPMEAAHHKLEQGNAKKSENTKVTRINDDIVITKLQAKVGEDIEEIPDVIDAIDYASMAEHDINSQSQAEGHIAKIIRKHIKYLRQVCDQCKDKVNKLNYINIQIQEIHYLKIPAKEDTGEEHKVFSSNGDNVLNKIMYEMDDRRIQINQLEHEHFKITNINDVDENADDEILDVDRHFDIGKS